MNSSGYSGPSIRAGLSRRAGAALLMTQGFSGVEVATRTGYTVVQVSRCGGGSRTVALVPPHRARGPGLRGPLVTLVTRDKGCTVVESHENQRPRNDPKNVRYCYPKHP